MAKTNTELLEELFPLVAQYVDGTLTLEEFTEQGLPIVDGWAVGGASVARSVRVTTETINNLHRWAEMVVDWYGGTVDGGPNDDGTYPLENSDGEISFVPSPAKLVSVIAKGDPGVNARHGFGIFLQNAMESDELVLLYVAPAAETYAPASCRAVAVSPPTAPFVFTMLKNGAAWGTVTFGTGSTTGTFSIPTPTLAAGDVLTVRAPVASDPAFANVGITLVGA